MASDPTARRRSGRLVELELLWTRDLRRADPTGPPRLVLGLDWCKGDGDALAVAADGENDVWVLPEDQRVPPRLVLEGQSGDVYGAAPHPTLPHGPGPPGAVKRPRRSP